MSLYEKYRPRTLGDVIGNKAIVEGITKALSEKDHNRSMMFHGPSGCGKTTFAGIVANMVGSQSPDLVRINGADDRKIDTARQINSDVLRRPFNSKCRMYIIDECHKLTNDTQNCLLDTTEKNPNGCYMLYCTTEPEKVIKTIRNRCTQYRVSPLRSNETAELLNRIAKSEGKELNTEVAKTISRIAEGVPRTAITYLESVLGVTDVDDAIDVIVGIIESDVNWWDLVDVLEKRTKDWKKVAKVYSGMKGDSEQMRRSLLTMFKNRMLTSRDSNAAVVYGQLLEIFEPKMSYVGEAAFVLMLFEATMAPIGERQ